MPGISQPFPNIFDPANLLGTTGASNTKIKYDIPSVNNISDCESCRADSSSQSERALVTVVPSRGEADTHDNCHIVCAGS